jgi:hypothetical protein
MFKAVDEKLLALSREIAGLRESRSESGGKSIGTHAVVAYVIAAISIILALLGFASRFVN